MKNVMWITFNITCMYMYTCVLHVLRTTTCMYRNVMFYNTLHYSLFTHIEISMRCACAVVHKIEILGGCGPYTVI